MATINIDAIVKRTLAMDKRADSATVRMGNAKTFDEAVDAAVEDIVLAINASENAKAKIRWLFENRKALGFNGDKKKFVAHVAKRATLKGWNVKTATITNYVEEFLRQQGKGSGKKRVTTWEFKGEKLTKTEFVKRIESKLGKLSKEDWKALRGIANAQMK
jgi:hypothetical protein